MKKNMIFYLFCQMALSSGLNTALFFYTSGFTGGYSYSDPSGLTLFLSTEGGKSE